MTLKSDQDPDQNQFGSQDLDPQHWLRVQKSSGLCVSRFVTLFGLFFRFPDQIYYLQVKKNSKKSAHI